MLLLVGLAINQLFNLIIDGDLVIYFGLTFFMNLDILFYMEKKMNFLEFENIKKDPKEEEANKFARNTLISENEYTFFDLLHFFTFLLNFF